MTGKKVDPLFLSDYTTVLFQVKEGERLGCAAMIPTVGVPNWMDHDQELEECFGERDQLQAWDSRLH